MKRDLMATEETPTTEVFAQPNTHTINNYISANVSKFAILHGSLFHVRNPNIHSVNNLINANVSEFEILHGFFFHFCSTFLF